MQDRKLVFGLSPIILVIILGAITKFALHMFNAPEYGFFGDEFYTFALSRHLAFGYVDLPPLVPALVALSRTLLGDSLFAMHIFPALAGAGTLIFVCLITKEFGGKTFAVALSAIVFIATPIWLSVNSIFCYDGIDQLILSSFLYVLVRFLHTENQKLWIVLGLLAGIACMAKTTILFMGPGFLIALLISKHRKDLLTPYPWLGAVLCVLVVSPYLFWEYTHQWPTLEYWTNYGTIRVYQSSILQYLINILVYMGPFLLPLWLIGLYRIFRRIHEVDYRFLGWMFVLTLMLLFFLHASARMIAELFIPLIAASTVFIEEMSAKISWGGWMRVSATTYVVAVGVFSILVCLPILPVDQLQTFTDTFMSPALSVKEFKGQTFNASPILSGRLGWNEMVQDVAKVYNELPEEERSVAGIYSDWYMPAGAIDQLGPQYGLPHAVSGSLTYYLWGPGYSWDVMIIISDRTNNSRVFFDECELKQASQHQYDVPVGNLFIYLCKKPKVSADAIWSSMKSYR